MGDHIVESVLSTSLIRSLLPCGAMRALTNLEPSSNGFTLYKKITVTSKGLEGVHYLRGYVSLLTFTNCDYSL